MEQKLEQGTAKETLLHIQNGLRTVLSMASYEFQLTSTRRLVSVHSPDSPPRLGGINQEWKEKVLARRARCGCNRSSVQIAVSSTDTAYAATRILEGGGDSPLIAPLRKCASEVPILVSLGSCHGMSGADQANHAARISRIDDACEHQQAGPDEFAMGSAWLTSCSAILLQALLDLALREPQHQRVALP